MTDTFDTVAGKLIENERGLGALYELFATAFAADADLWTALAAEEQQHADWIRHAIDAMLPEDRRRPLPSIRVPAVASMIQYVASVADRCRRGELTRRSALALARDIENSLLEGRLLDTLTASSAADAARHELVQGTTLHRKRIADRLARAAT